MSLGNALGWKFNHQPGMATLDGVITEFPGGIPTQADQDTWIIEYEAHLRATQYQRDRKAEYDKLNQFELIGEDSINGTANHRDAIAAIKARFPKA
jgi:hypothetical protein|tara:strand:+ start:1931 stop:2218 length:288 start_codon:yes stop_codon:yes gene_type:complete